MSRERITLQLPLPPTVNEMIDLAKKRTRQTWNGTWLRSAQPIVYNNAKTAYGMKCAAAAATQGVTRPVLRWTRWAIVDVTYEAPNDMDPIERRARLKWPVDWLVANGWVKNDSGRELVEVVEPAVEIVRKGIKGSRGGFKAGTGHVLITIENREEA